ncbi:extracellular solute-binding protein [Paenibacillus sp. alder61]|uniref:extracellular solute-binding protein n=1 Tax=Paenibacillus sp. alder61 TaxID=2862948 RepID=UPI001CD20B9C|nr:extracellular solute-binding protein [Paenibacillus sp. alder61]MCA1291418.1 extracellular solute-binding protein [Paenibacillus sp. alder61]
MRIIVKNLSKVVLSTLLLGSTMASCHQSSGIVHHREPEAQGEGVYSDKSLSEFYPPIEVEFVREIDDGLEDMLKVLPDETLEDNRWIRLYEQVLGIQIKYKWAVRSEQYHKKLDIMLASGDIADIVKVNAQQLRQLSHAGLIQDLTKVYKEYASPLTQQVHRQEGSGTLESGMIDGKLMGIPETDSSVEKAMFLWLRTDWLDRLGLQPPKTIDDVLEISKAFTDGDPDGNGQQDTFGIAATQYLWDPVMGLTGFMAGYGAYPNIWLEDESGKLVYGGIQPEVKQALKTLQDMYRNHEIESEFIFKNGSKAKQLIADGKIGMAYGEQWGSFLLQSSRNGDPDAEWQAFPIVADSGKAAKVPLKFTTSYFYAVRKDFAYPEAILKMFNLHLEKNWGKTAEYETYYNNVMPVWGLSPVTPFPADKNLKAYRQIVEARREDTTSQLQGEPGFIQDRIDRYLNREEDSESGWGWEKIYGASGAMSILDHYEKNNQLLFDAFAGAPTETMIERQTLLDNLQHDYFVNIILGEPIEQFDRFVEEWNRLGGADITAEVNQWHADKKSRP